MQIDSGPSPDPAALTMAQESRPTKTAWFDRMRTRMVDHGEARRGKPSTGQPTEYAWRQQLESERYGQPSQHASSGGGAGQPLQDVTMQEPGPSRSRETRRSSPRNRYSPIPGGEDEGLEADVEDNVNDRGERASGKRREVRRQQQQVL
jgi:hypothetical protein